MTGMEPCQVDEGIHSKVAEPMHMILVKIPEPLGPLEREARYGEPLHDLLERSALGFVNGGGTITNQQGETIGCYLDVGVANDAKGKEAITSFLADRGASTRTQIIGYLPGQFVQALTGGDEDEK